MKNLWYILYCALFTSCSSGFSSEQDFFNWISDENNGLIKERDFGRMKIRVKYLPDEYLVYNELKKAGAGRSVEMADSLRAAYRDTRTFLMTFEFEQEFPGENTLLYGTDSYEAYKERVEQLSFKADNYIRVECGSGEYRPVLWTLENTQAPGNRKNLYLVFPKEKPDDQRISMLFEDYLFETGISRYVFNKKHFDQIPEFSFIDTFLKQQ